MKVMRVVLSLALASFALYAAEVKLGAPLSQKGQVPIADLNAKPAEYVGKTVQVKGKVTQVCQKMGCWMMLVDQGTKESVRIKVKDGEIVFPASSVGKVAVAEGKFTRIEMTREQAIERARHDAEEQGRKFDPSSVKGPLVIYQIQGTGAQIAE